MQQEFLVLPAVDDQPVRRKLILGNRTLRGCDEVRQEWVGRFQARKGTDGFSWKADGVKRISRLRVEKSQQGARFLQAFDGDGKREVVQHPDNNPVEGRPLE